MTDPDSRAGLQPKVARVVLALQYVGVHEHVAEELARNFVAVAIFWEPGDPSLHSAAVAAMAQRWEHPGAGLGQEWHEHLPTPGRWQMLAQAMVEAVVQHDTPQACPGAARPASAAHRCDLLPVRAARRCMGG